MSLIPGFGDDAYDPEEAPPEYCFVIELKESTIKLVNKEKTKDSKAYLPLEDIPTKLFRTLVENYNANINPKLDDCVHCEKCGEFRRPWCLKHPLYWCPDRDPKDKEGTCDRAASTVPPFLKIRNSNIPKAGKGVITTSEIPYGMVFGPYEGTLKSTNTGEVETYGYAWELRDKNSKMYIDGSNPYTSNWMRFINSSRSYEEQNLMAFQYMGKIYYRVIKPILPEYELLVWYGAEYGQELGVFTTADFSENRSSKKRSTSGSQFVLS